MDIEKAEKRLKAAFEEIRAVKNNISRLDFEALTLEMFRDIDNGGIRESVMIAGQSAIKAHEEIVIMIRFDDFVERMNKDNDGRHYSTR